MSPSSPMPATPRRAPAARRGYADRIAAWRDLHLYSLVSSIGRMAARPWASVMTIGVMAIALALPLCLMLVLGNVERISGTFREAREVTLFLQPHLTAAKIESARAAVAALPQTELVTLRTPDESLEEFREMADFAGPLALLDDNPLPAVLVVTPAPGTDESLLADTLRNLPDADFVQHDAEWRRRLAAWLEFARRLTGVVAIMLGLGVLLVVGNTVRLDIQGRAEEIQTVQLLGATDGFVRRPFLYLGAWYGALSAIAALLIAVAARHALQSPLSALVESYGGSFELRGLSAGTALAALVLAIAIGWIGAWLAAGYHLRQTLPQGGS